MAAETHTLAIDTKVVGPYNIDGQHAKSDGDIVFPARTVYLPHCSCGWHGSVWKPSEHAAIVSWQEFHGSRISDTL